MRLEHLRSSRRIWSVLTLSAAVAMGWSAAVLADIYSDREGVPRLIPFRANLVSNGVPVTQRVTVEISIYDRQTAGALLWGPEVHTVVPVEGNFSVMLGETESLAPSILAGGEAWVAVSIGAIPLAGRLRLGASPYALRAAN